MRISPGTYLARRREAAGLTVEDVALRVETTPYPMTLHDRVAWLRNIESGVAELSVRCVVALHQLYPFSMDVLVALVKADPEQLPPRLCRLCASSSASPEAWAAVDLCCGCNDEHPARSAQAGRQAA